VRIRKSAEQDFDRIMEIYAFARAFMAKNGNPNQWGPTNWPPEELIRRDIREGSSYICENDEGQIIGTFFFVRGDDIEPTYRQITDGAWLDNSQYGVVHRLASDGSEKGIGSFCLNWAFEHCGHLRVDTHGDNTIMQNLVKKLGFVHCGTIYVEEDDYPRLAYEKTEDTEKYANREKIMEKPDYRVIEELFERDYRVIDILPKQVPEGGGGQYFAVEKYMIQRPGIDEIFHKFTNILLKLNCYYDFAVSSDGEEPAENPDPETLSFMMARCAAAGRGFVNIFIPSEESLIAVNGGDLYMTVYDPTDELLETVKLLASSEGLFVR
jgi:RimJ/RimL family protein N-acetyltransferase